MFSVTAGMEAKRPAPNCIIRIPTADDSGNVYIADTYNFRIREVASDTGIITIAGNGADGFSGDGPATENTVQYPNAVRVDSNGNVFIADTTNNRMRWVDAGGTMTTFAGAGTSNFSGDGGPAVLAELANPQALFEDASGNFLVADTNNYRLRKINAFAAIGRSTGSVNFPVQNVGTTSGAFDVTLSGIGPASISNSGDFSELDDCIGSLPNNTDCTVSVYFTPTKTGKRYGTLTVTSNGFLNTTSTVALQGTAVGLTITGTPLAIGNVPLGSSATKSVTIKGATTYNSVYLSGDTTDFVITTPQYVYGSGYLFLCDRSYLYSARYRGERGYIGYQG